MEGNRKEIKDVKRSQLYWADFGKSNIVGSEQRDIRPVVVVQNNIGNKYSPTTIVAVVTSQLTKAKLPTHVEINEGVGDIKRDSIILTEQTKTIDKRRLISYIGDLDDITMSKVDDALKISLDLETLQEQRDRVQYEEYISKLNDKVNEIKGLDYFITKWIKVGNALKDIKEDIQELNFRMTELEKLKSEYRIDNVEYSPIYTDWLQGDINNNNRMVG